jgi:hypothetical protein
MAMRLYKFEATKTTTMVVAAESREEAMEMAPRYVDDAFDDASPGTDVDYCGEVDSEKNLVSWGWDSNSIPYGDNVDDRKCGDIIRSMTKESEFNDKQLPLPLVKK